MVPFRGTFDHTLDAKNRLTVPARYRAALSDGVVLAMPVDLKPCVGVWRPQEYDSYTRRGVFDTRPMMLLGCLDWPAPEVEGPALYDAREEPTAGCTRASK